MSTGLEERWQAISPTAESSWAEPLVLGRIRPTGRYCGMFVFESPCGVEVGGSVRSRTPIEGVGPPPPASLSLPLAPHKTSLAPKPLNLSSPF